jgi:predicted nicotinamide N-methyase
MSDYDVGERRVLEVGCGIGLPALVLQSRGVDVTATDSNPRAGEFLAYNTRLNGLDPIPFAPLGWDDPANRSDLGLFDLIIASDVLYERGQVRSVAGFIDRHARATCEVLVFDPGRKNCGSYGASMQDGGFADGEAEPPPMPPRARLLRHTRRKT